MSDNDGGMFRKRGLPQLPSFPVGRWLGIGAAVILALILVMSCYYTVGQGERAVLTQFGAVIGVKEPGLHFKLPFIQSIQRISVRVFWWEWGADSAMETYSKDQQVAKLSVKVAYHAKSTPVEITRIYSEYRDLDSFSQAELLPRILKGVKTTFGRFVAVTAIQNRAQLNVETEEAVRALVQDLPVIIDNVSIQDISFSDEYENSIEQRMKAQVEVERVQQNLQRTRIEAEIKVVEAEASAKAVRMAGEAEGAAIRARGEALQQNAKLPELVAAEKWDGHLPSVMPPGGTVPFLSLPQR